MMCRKFIPPILLLAILFIFVWPLSDIGKLWLHVSLFGMMVFFFYMPILLSGALIWLIGWGIAVWKLLLFMIFCCLIVFLFYCACFFCVLQVGLGKINTCPEISGNFPSVSFRKFPGKIGDPKSNLSFPGKLENRNHIYISENFRKYSLSAAKISNIEVNFG